MNTVLPAVTVSSSSDVWLRDMMFISNVLFTALFKVLYMQLT